MHLSIHHGAATLLIDIDQVMPIPGRVCFKHGGCTAYSKMAMNRASVARSKTPRVETERYDAPVGCSRDFKLS